MTDNIPKPSVRRTGLSPKEQKLQALREKLANAGTDAKPLASVSGDANLKARNSFTGKKTAFQRKAT